jgi:tetratricopeptide (TPR) repeat protein/predicted Ser/Thr protein kinase
MRIVSSLSDERVTRAFARGPDDAEMEARVADRLFGDELPAAPRIGRFTVLHKIGSGGLGVVYAAYDPQLDRRVAIKIVRRRSGATGGFDARRVLREAQALARLAHPNVVSVHDVGEHDDGLFIAMELVEGVTLSEWVEMRGRGWRDVVPRLIEAGRGLAAAHRAGIVHRDFKPANVLIGADGRARVLDFGLARAATDMKALVPAVSSTLDEQITQSGTMLGTPAYLAPEQWTRGHGDARSDQWAFCVAAFELLWGKRPFAADDMPALRAKIIEGRIEPPKPPQPIPPWLQRVVQRGLEVDVDKRYPTMDALLVALERGVRPRRRPIVWMAAAAALVLAGAGVGSLATRAPTEGDPELVERFSQDARHAAAAGHYVYPPSDAPQTPTAYAKVVALETAEGPIAAAAKRRASELREEFATALVALGDEWWSREGGRPFAVDFYAAALLFDPTDEHARERAPLTTGELVALRERATRGDFSDAELGVADALVALAEPDEQVRTRKLGAVVTKRKGKMAASTADSLERLIARDTKAPSTQPRAADAAPASASSPTASAAVAAAPRDPAKAKALVAAGRKALRAGKFGEAESAFHQALAADARSHAALAGLSDAHFERGAYAQALEHARRAVALAPKVAAYRMQLGDASFKVLRYVEAREAYAKAKALGHPGAAAALAKVDARLGSAP